MPHPRTPDAIHPAFRQDTYLTPESILTKAIPPAPIIRRVSSTPELSDTGIRLGRLELPATTTRELINIPLAERQRHIAQKQLYRNAGLPSPIITPDGAVLSANFNSLPVDTDSHAMSFMNYGESSERGRGLRLSLMSKRKSTTTQLLSPSQSQSPGPLSPPPLYRAEWRKSSKEVKEKMKEAFRRKP
ncbi:uncharacterized protein BDV17DRAFT_293727 [Aspergillus undulatus]|uniref:uncharacterized protein n=1 Tax=Aspergillus undulatus TaxID=1810928 RepID=UPI003CCDE3AF